MKPRLDAGLTLVELLVTCLLLGLVFSVVGGIYVAISSTERTVSAITTTTSSAQSAASAIEAGIRNASEFQLTDHGADQLLVARTADRAATLTWTCRAWYFSAADGGAIYFATEPEGTAIAAPSSAQLDTWSLLVSGVSPRSGSKIFAPASTGISMSFDATTPGQVPVAIKTTVVPRTGVQEAGTCY